MASEDQIADFCAITNSSPEVAKSYLQLADGDLQQAVMLFMEGGLGNISHETTTTSVETTGGSSANPPIESSMTDEELARQLQEEDQIRAPIAAKHDILTGGSGIGSSWTPRERVTPVRSSIFNQGDSASGSMSEFMSRLNAQTTPPPLSSPESISSPSSKAKRLADLFRPPFDIMYRGSFEEAREDAKEKNKWVLVNIQDPIEFSCQVLNRDLWSDSFIKDIIKASFVFLQYANQSPEGQRYRTFYQILQFPHIAVIDARTGERVKVWEKGMKPTDFMMEITEFLEQHEGVPSIMKRPRKMKEVAEMTEEEQLNAAIQASLDSPKKTSSSSSEEDTTTNNNTTSSNISVPEQSTQQQQQAVITQMDVDEQEEEEDVKAGSLFDGIKAVKREETKDMSSGTRVQFRMPSGQRVVRRFLKSDPVRYLFEFVKSDVPDAEGQQFELVFNRTQLIDKLDQSIEEAGLKMATVNCVFV